MEALAFMFVLLVFIFAMHKVTEAKVIKAVKAEARATEVHVSALFAELHRSNTLHAKSTLRQPARAGDHPAV